MIAHNLSHFKARQPILIGFGKKQSKVQGNRNITRKQSVQQRILRIIPLVFLTGWLSDLIPDSTMAMHIN